MDITQSILESKEDEVSYQKDRIKDRNMDVLWIEDQPLDSFLAKPEGAGFRT